MAKGAWLQRGLLLVSHLPSHLVTSGVPLLQIHKFPANTHPGAGVI